MNPQFANLPMKGWTLLYVSDGDAHCDYCSTKIRWEYHLQHPDVKAQLIVGNECVKSFINAGDADAALKFFKHEWTQRRGYYYKRAHDRTFVIGQDKGKRWWVAFAPGVRSPREYWTFSKRKYATSDAAQRYVLQLVCSGYASVVTRCPWPQKWQDILNERSNEWE